MRSFEFIELCLVVFSGPLLLFFYFFTFFHFKTKKGGRLFTIICVLVFASLFFEGRYIYKSRNNYAVVLRVEGVEEREEYWSKNKDYTSLGGENRTLRPIKEAYYVDNNTSYRIRLYEVVYYRGKLKSSETVGYIEPYKLAGLNQEPKFKFVKPSSSHETRFYKSGDSEEVNVNERYLCMEFCVE